MNVHPTHDVRVNSVDAYKDQDLSRLETVYLAVSAWGPITDRGLQEALGGHRLGWQVQPKISVLVDKGRLLECDVTTNTSTHRPCRLVRVATEDERQARLEFNRTVKRQVAALAKEAMTALKSGHDVHLVIGS